MQTNVLKPCLQYHQEDILKSAKLLLGEGLGIKSNKTYRRAWVSTSSLLNHSKALCLVASASVLVDLTILFVYNYESFLIFKRSEWQMQNILLIIRNIKNLIMMFLPLATTCVAYLLYDTLNRKQLWCKSIIIIINYFIYYYIISILSKYKI